MSAVEILHLWPVLVGFVAVVGLGCWLLQKASRRWAWFEDRSANDAAMRLEPLHPEIVFTNRRSIVDGPTLRGEPFGYKTGWIAIRSDDEESVVELLELRAPARLGWTAGVKAAYGQGVFVTPTVNGWTLVMGAELMDGTTSAEKISARLGCEVQVFASYRVSESHLWERASGTTEYRLFSIDDGGVKLEGPPTDVERDLGIDEFAAAWTNDDFDDVRNEIPDEDTVMTIAGKWSLDPSQLSDPDDRLGWYSESWSNRAFKR